MNAQMRIYVRVINAASPQLAQVQSQLRGLQASTMGAATAGSALGRASDGMLKWGKNMQWTGRQIEYNFTLPLVLAGTMAQKWANENETAFIRVQKVYGDASMSSQQMQNETNALRKAFVDLSNMTGIAQKDILEIAGDWAAAGSSGLALGKATRLTAEAMILGEMSAEDASKALISIQAQYGFTTGEINRNRAALEAQAATQKNAGGFVVKTLADTVAVLNMVENQTGVSFEGLVQGFQRAAGTARTAGVDVQHLAAFIAAISPAAGTAAQAGNALKTIFTRLLVPTKQASDLLSQIGINTRDVAWQNKNGTQRLEELAQAYTKLNPQQQMFLDKAIAGTYQISRFSVMMRSITDSNGYYQKALKSTNSEAAVQLQYIKELGMVLDSQPNKFKILTTTIQNSLASAIIPLTPAILGVLKMITSLAQGFANLDPRWQKLIMFSLLFVAILGPVLRYVGAFAALFGIMGNFFVFMAARISLTTGALASLFGMLRLSAAWDVFVAGATGAARLVVVALTSIGPLVMPFFTWLGVQLSGLLSGSFFRTFVGGAITRAWAALMFALGPITSAAGAAITAIWEGVWMVLGTTTSAGGPVLARLWGFVMATIELVTAGVASSVITIWEAMQAAMVSVTAFGRSAVLAIYTGFSFVLQGLWLNLTTGLSALWTRMWAFMSMEDGAAGVIASARAFFGRIAAIFMGGFAELRTVATAGWAAAIASPLYLVIGAAVVAALALIVHFRSQIGQAFGNIRDVILRAFYALPRGVQSAFIAVINVIRSAISAVREWLSYLNPFQRHSPSLVDNVTAGTAVIAKKYKGLSQSVINSIATAKAAMDSQQATVNAWKDRLDAAQDSVDKAQKALDKLQKTAQTAQDALSASKDALSTWSQTPIVGMRAMSDAIFNNDLAAKKLQLQIMKLEDAGKAPDQLADKFSKLQGDIDQLRGDSQQLRAMGAGSDVLGPINDQIKAMDKQADAIQQQQVQYGGLADQLDALNRKGQELDLENSIKFDPLTRSIDQMTNSMKEVPFDEIVKNIRIQQAEVNKNQKAYDAATAAVDRQQAVVDKLKDIHDAISDTYDAEQKKLDKLKDAYDALTEAADNAAAGLEKTKDASDAVKDFNAAGAATAFPDPGTDATIGREGGMGDQTDQINQMADEWAKESKDAFGKIDMFGPFKDMFKAAVKWVDDHTGGWLTNSINKMKSNPGVTAASAAVGGVIGFAILGPIGGILGAGLGALVAPLLVKLDIGGKLKAVRGWLDASGITPAFQGAGQAIGGFFRGIADVAGKLWSLFGPDVMKLLDAIGKGLVYAFQQLWSAMKPIGDLIGPIGEAFGHLWHIIEPLVTLALTPLLGIFKVLASVIADTVGPAFKLLVDLVSVPIHMLIDIIGFFVSLINGDWSKAFHYLGQLFKDTFGGFGKIVGDAFGVVIGIVKGFVGGIVHFFEWLFDVLVGHSIIPDLVNAIVSWFFSLPGKIIKALWNLDVEVAKWAIHLPITFFNMGLKADTWLLNMGAKIVYGLVKGLLTADRKILEWVVAVNKWIVNALWDADKWLFWTGVHIVEGLFKGLYTIGAKVVEFFTKVPKYFYDAASDAPKWLIQKGKDIVSGLFTGISNAITGDGPSRIRDFIKAIVKWFTALPKAISDGIVPLIGDMFDWVTAIPDYLIHVDWIGVAMSIVDKIGDAINWAIHNPGQIAKITGYIALGLAAIILGVPLLLAAALLTIAGSIVLGIINGILNLFGTNIGSLAKGIGKLLITIPLYMLDAAQWLFGTGKDMLSGFINGAEWKVADLVAWLVALPGRIWNWVGDAKKWIVNKGSDLIYGLLLGITNKAVDVYNWFRNLPKNIQNLIANAGTWIKNHGSLLIGGFLSGIGGRAGDVYNFFRATLPNSVKNLLSNAGSWIYVHGMNLLTGFLNGIGQRAQDVYNFFRNTLPNSIGNLMSGAGNWLVNAGKNVLIGFWNGLQSMGKWLADQVWNLVKGAIPDVVQRVLGMHSPSRVMMDLGQLTVQGLAIGISDNIGTVAAAAQQMAQAAANGVDPSAITKNAGLSFTESFRMGMIDGAGGVLDTAQSIAAGVNATFANVQPPTVDFKVNKQNTQLPWQASAIQSGAYTLPAPSGMVTSTADPNTSDSSSLLAPPVTNNNVGGDMHFHGELSFPNITNGDDAKEFISNLKALAK